MRGQGREEEDREEEGKGGRRGREKRAFSNPFL